MLKEIHAYWVSEFVTVDDVYRQLYETPIWGYQNLYHVSKERFTVLCHTMDWLYAAFDGDFSAIAGFVGDADSVADFEHQSQALIETFDRGLLETRQREMWKEKAEFRQVTKD